MVLIGTSGWTYPHWREIFYPDGLAAGRWLSFYGQRFGTVEINGTFYSMTRPGAVARWRAAVPDDFVFAVKGSRYLTHMLKLRRFAAPLANFFAQGLLVLGRQLGPILWQLPPRLTFERARIEPFLAALPRDIGAAEKLARRHDQRVSGRAALHAPEAGVRGMPLRYALEVRDESWLAEQALALLEAYDVALVTADTAARFPASSARTARDFAYFRLHGSRVLYGSRYTDEELASWAARVAALRDRGADVYVYFDNDAKAYAPSDAARLMEKLGIAPAAGLTAPARDRGSLPPTRGGARWRSRPKRSSKNATTSSASTTTRSAPTMRPSTTSTKR